MSGVVVVVVVVVARGCVDVGKRAVGSQCVGRRGHLGCISAN